MSLQIKVAKAQGDPGLFGFLGKAVGTIARVGASFVPGPAGAIARTLTSKIFGGAQPAAPTALPTAVRTLPPIMNGGFLGTVAARARAAALPQYVPPALPESAFAPQGTITMPTGEVGFDTTPAIGCPQGYKPNKSGYYRRIRSPGNPEGSVFYIAPKSRCVKIRKRNPANPRAADRAVNRIQSAKRFATKMNRITIRKKCD